MLPNALRQYTPPTCTLEIMAQTTSSSPGIGRATSPLSFVLRFDDPRLPELEPVSIQGDRHQLETLHAVVTTYVEDLLKQSPEYFNPVLDPTAYSSSDLPASSQPHVVTPIPPTLTSIPSGKIFIQPGSNKFNHNLLLGPLETKTSGAVIRLSVLQLFDLSTALDECMADVAALPTRTRTLASAPSSWAGIAAVLLLVVGVTTATVVFLNRNKHPQIATPIAQNPNTITPPPITLTPSATPLVLPLAKDKLPLIGVPIPSPGLPGIKGTSLPATSSPKLPGVLPSTASPGILIAPKQESFPSSTYTDTNNLQLRAKKRPTISNVPNGIPLITPSSPELGISTTPVPSITSAPLTPKSSEITRGTAFDTIPQIAEARNYFKQRWEPPSGLTQTLEYSLIIDTNGSIQRIIPLGQAARIYVDRSGMPLIGEPFVSPIKNGQSPRIRVVLSPDGQVQTFQDSENLN